MSELDQLIGLFESANNGKEKIVSDGMREKDPSSSPQPKDGTASLSSVAPFARGITETMDSSQVDHGIFSMIEETNRDEHGRMKNTPLSYEAKKLEFRLYCDAKYGGLPLERRYTVTGEKVKEFMFYVAFREQKKKGRKPKGSARVSFDLNQYERISTMVKWHLQDSKSRSLMEELEPKNGVAFSVINSTKAALREMWAQQVDDGINNLSESNVFGRLVSLVLKHVKSRKSSMSRKNFKEKMDNHTAPMEAVQHIDAIEGAFFKNAIETTTGGRAVHANLRDRFTFLATTKGLLRGETLYKCELSDIFRVLVKKESDPHPLFILIMQFETGKVNRGFKLYGRMAQNFDVNLCPVGALGFYLMYRFARSKEMEQIDFSDNKDWFNIKLLTSFQSTKPYNEKCMQDKSYATAVKRICKKERIPTSHFVHIGRVLGSYECELNKDLREDISNLGNWGLNVQETRYSTKIPMGIIRSKARLSHKVNWNPRIGLSPPKVLTDSVFPWLGAARAKLDMDGKGNEMKVTARCFLLLMKDLAEIVIQDAAALAVEFPERMAHPMFQSPIFRSIEFQEYLHEMKVHLETSKSPFDSSLEQILPGVNGRLNGQQTQLSEIRSVGERNSSMLTKLTAESKQAVTKDMLSNEFGRFRASFGAAAAILADSMSDGATRTVRQSQPRRTHGDSPSPNSSATSTAVTVAPPVYYLPMVRSATELWNMWYGKHEFNDKPVKGGVDALERNTSATWRKAYTKQERRMFSRYKRCIELMKEEFDATPTADHETFFSSMDRLYQHPKKPTITPFEANLKKRKADTLSLA